ncbi:hypothetical protein MPTK1_2g07190 [Marchantia polymorpha subsp. ruderalis]|uniref:Uncharacterized protein n=1 Tax=Marchantia polymorpha TaxID=3197 RepID=A0A2R6XGF4_MARPO|nr:hypothetical protein MARPO_0015s0007 [Marchantia polymorpha]BBN01412.1 hypothetical protein Mp_2g07190 [Marchantia polymorpha subsp. ruderalis]|eukprot:PTQ45182.1 hypothetical protein MARPO_0015s0007 [Marchantia polymorpha]
MELTRPLAPIPPSWWTGGGGVSLWPNAKIVPDHISVKRVTPIQDLHSFASTIPLNSRTSVEGMVRGTKIRMSEMRVKLTHKFLNSFQSDGRQAGILGLTVVTDLDRRHRMTLESTLGCDEDKQSMSAFISSKFEPRMSWGIALSHRLHQAVTLFSRFNSDESSRHRYILQVVHKMGERTTCSPILSKVSGDQPQAGLSWTHQLRLKGRPMKNFIQVKLFWSGNGAYAVNIRAQVGELDAY